MKNGGYIYVSSSCLHASSSIWINIYEIVFFLKVAFSLMKDLIYAYKKHILNYAYKKHILNYEGFNICLQKALNF